MDTALQLNITYRLDTLRLANTYEAMAQVTLKKKNLMQQKIIFFTALAYFQEIYKDEPWLLADFYENMTFLYTEFNKPNKIIQYAEKGLKIYNSIQDKEKSDFYGMASANNNLGIGYEILDKLPKAIYYYQQALAINQQFPIDRAFNIAYNWNNLGLAYKRQGSYIEALNCYDKALTILSPALTNQDKSDFFIIKAKPTTNLTNTPKL